MPGESDIAGASPQEHTAQPVFFAVSVRKLLVLSICTFGVYELYWFYRHWKLVRDRTGERISPAPRALFPGFFCYSLFSRIRGHDLALASSRLPAGLIAVGWIVLSLLWGLPDPYSLLAYFASILVLGPVQAAANTVNRAVAPAHQPNARFAPQDWVVIVPGGLLFALAMIGILLPQA